MAILTCDGAQRTEPGSKEECGLDGGDDDDPAANHKGNATNGSECGVIATELVGSLSDATEGICVSFTDQSSGSAGYSRRTRLGVDFRRDFRQLWRSQPLEHL